MAKAPEKKSFSDVMKSMGIDLDAPDGYIRTGIPTLDMFLAGEIEIGDGNEIGIPKGKNIILSGDSGIGKSTLMLEISKRTCLQDMIVVYLDFELGLNAKSTKSYGVKPFVEKNKFIVANPVTYTGTFQFLDAVYKEFGRIDLVIIDSLRAILPEEWIDNNEAAMSLAISIQARKEGPFMMIMKQKAHQYGFSLVYLNQMRIKNDGYQFRQAEAGGNSAKFTPDIRLIAKEVEKIKRKVISNGQEIDRHIGSWVQLFSKKNRYGNTMNGITLPLLFGAGVSMIMLITRFLEIAGFVTMGTWKKLDIPDLQLTFNTQKEDELYNFVRENYEKIEDYVYSKNLIFIDKVDVKKLTKEDRDELGIDENGRDLDEIAKERNMQTPRGRREATKGE